MTVAVVVPFRGDGGDRDQSWRWVRARWEALYPAWQVVAAGAPPGPWCKAAAVAAAVARTDAEVLVVADADVWCEPTAAMVDAVRLAQAGAWVVPHQLVRRLDRGSSYWFRAGHRTGLSLAQAAHTGVPGGGLFVIHRQGWDTVGGFDPRLDAREDTAFGLAADTLLGHHVRLDATLWHLWHPPRRHHSSSQGRALVQKYRGAADDPVAVQALVEEARSWRA